MILSKLTSSGRSSLQMMLRRMASSGSHGGHAESSQLWKKLFFFVCIPAIAISAVNTYISEKEHYEHFHREEFVPYEHLRIQNKNFPWGDGKHTLFHNPKVNPLPDGWEELPGEKGHH